MTIEQNDKEIIIDGSEFVKGVDDTGEFETLENAVEELCGFTATLSYDTYLKLVDNYDIEDGDVVTCKNKGKKLSLLIEKCDGEEFEDSVSLRKL